MAISNEEYAWELQLQEVIMSSALESSSIPGPAATFVFCKICLDAVPPSDAHCASRGCGHAFCATCVATYVGVNIQNSVAHVKCPEVGCDSVLDPELCRGLLPREAFVAWCAVMCESMLLEEVIMSSAAAAMESSSIPGPAATFVFCKICLDAVPPSDARCASRGCGHAFCATCVATYVGVNIQNSVAHVKCPEVGCDCMLDPELCRGLLPGEAFEAWCAVMCESMLLGANKVYCPFKDCSAMMVGDDGDGVQAAECPCCRGLFCARCGVPWHAGVGCAEYGQLAAGDRGKEDLVVMDMAKGENWKRCPNCRFIVQKSGGCRHITCRCGFEFCYGCGKQWGASHSSCSAA